jgi:hypothetical protein
MTYVDLTGVAVILSKGVNLGRQPVVLRDVPVCQLCLLFMIDEG